MIARSKQQREQEPTIVATAPLGFPWQTLDPFLFCVHHDDAYPAGNEDLGPAAPLDGRDLGQDFAGNWQPAPTTASWVVSATPPADYPLWLAQYPNQYVPGMEPSLPRGWFKWTFWQYSEKGRINGINAGVELNLFNGALEELYKFAGAQINIDRPQTPQKHTIAAGDSSIVSRSTERRGFISVEIGFM